MHRRKMGRLEVRILISLSCRLFAYEQVVVVPSNYLRLIASDPDEVLSQNPAAVSLTAPWKAEALYSCMCFVLPGSYLTEFCA